MIFSSADSLSRPPARIRRSILFRVVLLSWAVIVFTVVVMLIATIPYQKSRLLEALEERAKVASSSISQVATSSIVVEDFSAVVDHCAGVVNENPSLLYVVITRQNDGFSLVHTKDNWTMTTLDGLWNTPWSPLPQEGHFLESDLVERRVFHVSFPFSYSGIDWGWIHLGLSPEKFYADRKSLYIRTALVALLAVSVGLLGSYSFARRLSRPIRELEQFTRRVASGNFSGRLEITSGDEVESLADSFNQMTDALRKSKEELFVTHKELVDTARKVGMAEVATGVLHNVGNVLNSINVTSDAVNARVRDMRLGGLAKTADLLAEHADDSGNFLADDERGRKIPAFIQSVSDHIEDERKILLEQLGGLITHVQHVTEIINLQQSYSKVGGLTEPVSVGDLIEDAIRISRDGLTRHGVRLVRAIDNLPPRPLDRYRILQIITNLISNAEFALADSDRGDKTLAIRAWEPRAGLVRIEVSDNGVGIPPENLTKIFSHGFTTRRDGHGFGLHSGALAATEMDGSLTVHSDGPGTGATFTLDLPFRRKEN